MGEKKGKDEAGEKLLPSNTDLGTGEPRKPAKASSLSSVSQQQPGSTTTTVSVSAKGTQKPQTVQAKFEEYLNKTFGKTVVNVEELALSEEMDEVQLLQAIKSLEKADSGSRAERKKKSEDRRRLHKQSPSSRITSEKDSKDIDRLIGKLDEIKCELAGLREEARLFRISSNEHSSSVQHILATSHRTPPQHDTSKQLEDAKRKKNGIWGIF